MKNICKRLLLKMFHETKKIIKSPSQHFEKEIYQYVIQLAENTFFKKELLVTASYRKALMLESLFSSECCKIFNTTYFEQHLHMAGSENVFMKLIKIKIYKEF